LALVTARPGGLDRRGLRGRLAGHARDPAGDGRRPLFALVPIGLAMVGLLLYLAMIVAWGNNK
jgi:hypothetical protein